MAGLKADLIWFCTKYRLKINVDFKDRYLQNVYIWLTFQGYLKLFFKFLNHPCRNHCAVNKCKYALMMGYLTLYVR